jgi:hypothetical protein
MIVPSYVDSIANLPVEAAATAASGTFCQSCYRDDSLDRNRRSQLFYEQTWTAGSGPATPLTFLTYAVRFFT